MGVEVHLVGPTGCLVETMKRSEFDRLDRSVAYADPRRRDGSVDVDLAKRLHASPSWLSPDEERRLRLAIEADPEAFAARLYAGALVSETWSGGRIYVSRLSETPDPDALAAKAAARARRDAEIALPAALERIDALQRENANLAARLDAIEAALARTTAII